MLLQFVDHCCSFLTANIHNLAHPAISYEQIQISLLIGADHYWDIVENDIIRSLGPTAANSKIVYFLSGPVLNHSPTSTTFNARILNVIVLNERV